MNRMTKMAFAFPLFAAAVLTVVLDNSRGCSKTAPDVDMSQRANESPLQEVKVGDLDIFYASRVEGRPTVLLLHGFRPARRCSHLIPRWQTGTTSSLPTTPATGTVDAAAGQVRLTSTTGEGDRCVTEEVG